MPNTKTSTTKQNNRRHLFPLVGVLIIVALAVSATVYYQRAMLAPYNNLQVTEYAKSWTTYTAPSGKFSIDLPAGWKFERYYEGDAILALSPEELTFKFGTPAEVEVTKYSYKVGFIALNIGFGSSDRPESSLGTFVGERVTLSGDVVRLYEHTDDQNAKVYEHFVQGHGVDERVSVIYRVRPSDPDQSRLIGEMVDTVKIL